jgi:uncharacterized membrane protein YphA (DoxX/SURF4 family)
MKRTTIIESVVFLYSILFLYTGISKLTDHNEFKESIRDAPFLAPISTGIAWGTPLLEFFVTLLLIIPRWRLKGLYASLTLMIVFTGYVIALLLFDENLPCSCGGIIQQLSWRQHLAFNIAFLLLAIGAVVLQKREINAQQKKWDLNDYPILGQREHSM